MPTIPSCTAWPISFLLAPRLQGSCSIAGDSNIQSPDDRASLLPLHHLGPLSICVLLMINLSLFLCPTYQKPVAPSLAIQSLVLKTLDLGLKLLILVRVVVGKKYWEVDVTARFNTHIETHT